MYRTVWSETEAVSAEEALLDAVLDEEAEDVLTTAFCVKDVDVP